MKQHILIIAAIALLFSSCEKEIKFNGHYSGEKLVLFSNVNTGSDQLTLRLYKSRFFLSEAEEPLGTTKSGAEVSAEINGRSFTLTEDPENRGNYIMPYKAQPGDEVSIRAHLDGFADVTSSTVVPQKPDFEILSCRTEAVKDFFGARNIIFRILIHDDGSSHDYYKLNIIRNVPDVGFFRTGSLYSNDVIFSEAGNMNLDGLEDILGGDSETRISGLLDDGSINGQDYICEIYCRAFYEGILYDDMDITYNPDEIENWEPDLSQYAVEIDALSGDLYKYEVSRRAAWDSGELTEIFGEPVVIHNNIKDGIGCFGAITPRTIYAK